MLDLWHEFLRLFTELDVALGEIIAKHGAWTYAILFAIVFAETGLVITPFLPGDSLLFAAGALSAQGGLDIPLMMVILFTAAVLGDALNYHIGKAIGPPAFSGKFKLLKKSHLEKTQAFFDKHGGKAIIYARFVPIIRTFAPFVAGVGTMSYPRFLSYNIIGALLWIVGFVGAGALFGNIPLIKNNFSKVILVIIFVSVLPIAFEWYKVWRAGRNTQQNRVSK